MVIDLRGLWRISGGEIKDLPISIPGSVISGLLENHLINNPYYGLNEEKARSYLFDDYSFKRIFKINKSQLKKYNYLCLEGIDTVASVFINGHHLLETKNFHTSKKVLLDNKILQEENEIEIKFTSNYRYIKEYEDHDLFKTYSETEPKSIVERKPNYMFGWDWAPNLADMGMRNVSILSTDEGFLDSYRYEYFFNDDGSLELDISTDFIKYKDSPITIRLSLNNKVVAESVSKLENHNEFTFLIDNVSLWYPNGLGPQTLYDLTIRTNENEYRYRISFKKIKFDFSKNENGRNFQVFCNDKDIFLRGYNVVPEDNILSFVTNERTAKMLQLVKSTNANVIRVWGGGYYPSDYFYDKCDELGILVWQDLMFADAAYNYDDKEFLSLVYEEIKQQIKRIRNHVSVLLICGNNENEAAINGHQEIYKEHFIKMFCHDVKDIVNGLTTIQYLHSSPSNLDPLFNRPNDPNIFDVHYWEVGNGNLNYKAYGEIYPPMLSEFGLWSMPNYQTLEKYISKDQLYLFSKEIEAHSKRDGNFFRAKLNIEQQFKYDEDIKRYCYLTQLYQARGVKYCIEHLRNNISRCHGGIYWQFNDSWPVFSCSVIDYEYGLKAIFYYAKRFFNNEIVTIEDRDDVIKIRVSNLDKEKHQYQISYKYMNFDNEIFKEACAKIDVKEGSTLAVDYFDSPLKNDDEFIYAEIKNEKGDIIFRNIYQKKEDKDIHYPKAKISIRKIGEMDFDISSDKFTKDIYLSAADTIFSDNYFTLLKDEHKVVHVNKKIDADMIDIICINNL